MELQLIRAHEFIRLGAQGRFDLAASKAVLTQLAAACWKRGINRALLDLRALHAGPKPVFTPNDLVTLVKTFREIGFTHEERLAVLHGDDPRHRASLFAFIATSRGWQVQAFDNFEAAFLWLSGGEAPAAETKLTPGTEVVPVRRRKVLKSPSKPASRPISASSTRIPAPGTRRRSTRL
jgi:hypothetical protein